MGEHDGHRARMLAKFKKYGLDAFEPHEALEILLYFSRPRVNTNELAHRLISEFGSLTGVFDAPEQELLRVKGVGESTAALIKLVPQMMIKYRKSSSEQVIINDSTDAANHLLPRFFGKEKEIVAVMCLDAKNKLVYCSEVYEGSVNSVEISVAKIVSAAVNCKASKVILAHNHPSGNALPSEQDIKTTALIAQTLENMNIELYDHLIFADKDYVSMRDSEK